MAAVRSIRDAARRSIRALLAIPLVIALPAVVLGATVFGDVPPTHPFYYDITNVANAGIATGCGGGNYCPDANVTRGQMAAFLDRTGGRVGYSPDRGGSAIALNSEWTVLNSVTITAGSVTGRTAFVQLIASADVFTWSSTGLPAAASIAIVQPGVAMYSWDFAQVNGLTDQGIAMDNATVVAVAAVPTGVPVTFQVEGSQVAGTAVIGAWGTISATYYPFSENGDNVLTSSTAKGGTPKLPSPPAK